MNMPFAWFEYDLRAFDLEADPAAGSGAPEGAAPDSETLDRTRQILLRRMAETLDRFNRRLGRDWGPLTHSQWAMLRRLLDGPVLVGVLAERLDISTAGATRMLDKLEQAGFVCRSRATDDLRQVAASLTDSGRAAVQEAFAAHVARLGEVARNLSTTDLAAWLDVLDQMAPPKNCSPRGRAGAPVVAAGAPTSRE
jgi:DNA-binding MarR family transcriptional regulator